MWSEHCSRKRFICRLPIWGKWMRTEELFPDSKKSFGFGPSIVQWFKTFYNNTESCIMNNGWARNFFSVHRGVRQGCSLSPYLFILSAAILAKAIRKSADIRGLLVKDTEIKLSQYADDTTLILDGSEKSLSEALKILESFEKVSGLRLNSKKTEVLWIGSCAGKSEKLHPEKDFNWQNTKVKALGVWLSIDSEITVKLNFVEKMEKMRNCLGCWTVRRLSLIGKITVLKSLVASQVIHLVASSNQFSNYKANKWPLFWLPLEQ